MNLHGYVNYESQVRYHIGTLVVEREHEFYEGVRSERYGTSEMGLERSLQNSPRPRSRGI